MWVFFFSILFKILPFLCLFAYVIFPLLLIQYFGFNITNETGVKEEKEAERSKGDHIKRNQTGERPWRTQDFLSGHLVKKIKCFCVMVFSDE